MNWFYIVKVLMFVIVNALSIHAFANNAYEKNDNVSAFTTSVIMEVQEEDVVPSNLNSKSDENALVAEDEKQQNVWPMPKFYFLVDFGDIKNVVFQEMSGMDKEIQSIEYRASNSKLFSMVKMPSFVKYGNFTMKRGFLGLVY